MIAKDNYIPVHQRGLSYYTDGSVEFHCLQIFQSNMTEVGGSEKKDEKLKVLPKDAQVLIIGLHIYFML